MGIFDGLRRLAPQQPTAAAAAVPAAIEQRDEAGSSSNLIEPAQMGAGTAAAIGEKEISEAITTLTKYKSAKTALESRIVEDEEWYKLRHWEYLRRGKPHTPLDSSDSDDNCCRPPMQQDPEPASAWMFNALMNKHADAMDNYPEPAVLPRERNDEGEAKSLSAILPVIMEHNNFEATYSFNWWRKDKHGTGVYGAFWNPELENGLGDVDIHALDILKVFWEPGISDIQKSRNLFIVDLQDDDLVEAQWPQAKGKLGGDVIDVKEYLHTDVDTNDKSLVVDWYYKRRVGSRTLLHYVKFVGRTLLYASENDPRYQDQGWYWHGKYPVVFDILYPEEGSPAGFGLIAITKDPQLYIDKLSSYILKHSYWAANPRFWASKQAGVNRKEFLDPSNPIIEVEGAIDDNRLRAVEIPSMDPEARYILQMKIDELKETSGNRDVTAGSSGGGVTAASAISALQEAGNKSSRDSIAAGYRAFSDICYLVIELLRQFYDEKRSFRVEGQQAGQYEFIDYSNAQLRDQAQISLIPGHQQIYRHPVFDVKVKACKRNPFSRASQNELSKELYGLGFFNPERAQEALAALELMEFEGKDKVKEHVQTGQTLLNICQQMSAQMEEMALMLQGLTGYDMGAGDVQAQAGGATGQGTSKKGAGGFAKASGVIQQPTLSYQERLAKRSTPDLARMENGGATR